MNDAFEIFKLPHRFDLDEQELHQRFIRASSGAHPDRFTDPVEQAQAAEQAAVINEAYGVLQDAELRADLLVQLLGGPAKEQDKSLPGDLLMQVMQIREEMEQASGSGDQQALDKIAQWANQQRTEHLQRITGLFEQVESSPEQPQPERAVILKQVRLELNALRYFQRMIEQAPTPGPLLGPTPGIEPTRA